MSRVFNIDTWVNRLSKAYPITRLAVEHVKFDTQLMENPEISGVAYQHGTLYEAELWEYLLEKFDRKCFYCGTKDVPLEKEHILPRAKGGTDRADNLTIRAVRVILKKETDIPTRWTDNSASVSSRHFASRKKRSKTHKPSTRFAGKSLRHSKQQAYPSFSALVEKRSGIANKQGSQRRTTMMPRVWRVLLNLLLLIPFSRFTPSATDIAAIWVITKPNRKHPVSEVHTNALNTVRLPETRYC